MTTSSLTLRQTKGSRLTTAEMDTNLQGLSNLVLTQYGAPGSGAATETVAQALATTRAWISSDTVASKFYRADATFASSVVDHGTFIGYNLTGFGQIEDSTKSALMIGMEPDYHDGSTRHCELHFDLSNGTATFARPFFADFQLSGANSGLLVESALQAAVVVSLYAPLVQSTAAEIRITSADTTGPRISLTASDSGGKNWQLYSTGSVAGLGAGNLLIYNLTAGRYGLILDKNGSTIIGDLVAVSSNATDGFLYIPSCNGIPSGVPTSRTGKVPIIYDVSTNRIFAYNGAWKSTAALT